MYMLFINQPCIDSFAKRLFFHLIIAAYNLVSKTCSIYMIIFHRWFNFNRWLNGKKVCPNTVQDIPLLNHQFGFRASIPQTGMGMILNFKIITDLDHEFHFYLGGHDLRSLYTLWSWRSVKTVRSLWFRIRNIFLKQSQNTKYRISGDS